MIVRLRHGLRRDGRVNRDADVRALTGADQAAPEPAADRTASERVTHLLAAATVRLGTLTNLTAAEMGELTLGDRQFLAAAIYQITFGRHVDVVARCSAHGCAMTMDLKLDVGALRASTEPLPMDTMAWHEDLEVDGQRWTVTFRLLTGADHEAAARVAVDDIEGAADLLAERSLVSVVDAGGERHAAAEVIARARDRIGDVLEQADAGGEIVLQARCPGCGASNRVVLDFGLLLVGGVGQERDLVEDVHRLASAYHWSEREILALPVSRRHRYLALISSQRASS